MPSFKYKAFISYSHQDEKVAKWLHRALENYKVPKHLELPCEQAEHFGSRLSPIFRDREELAAATDLSDSINTALKESECLIVICSPAAAQSPWVNKEILTFKQLGRANKIQCLIINGEPFAESMGYPETTECFPESIRFHINEFGNLSELPAEPIAADLRPKKDGKNNAKLKLIAGLLGVGLNDLKQRELQRKHQKLAIISASAVMGMLIAIALASFAVISRNEAIEQRKIAEIETEKARQTTNFMLDLFAVSDPSEARGNSITAREILDRGASKIANDLKQQPLIKATLMETIGKVYMSLGLYDQAQPLIDSALKIRKKSFESNTELANSLKIFADLLTKKAEYELAESAYLEGIGLLQKEKPFRQIDALPELKDANQMLLLSQIYGGLAELYFKKGLYQQAEPLLRQVLELRQKSLGDAHPLVADAIEELGLNYFDQGDLKKSKPLLQSALAKRFATLGTEPHPEIAENINNLATLAYTENNLDEAEDLFEKSLSMKLILLGENHPDTAVAYNNLAIINHDKRALEKAYSMYQKVLSIQTKVFGENHPEVARTLNNLAYVLFDQGDTRLANDYIDKALNIATKNLSEDHPMVANFMATKARWLISEGHHQQAKILLYKAIATMEKVVEPQATILAIMRVDLTDALVNLNEINQAYQIADENYQIQSQSNAKENWINAISKSALGYVLSVQAQCEAATPLMHTSHKFLGNNAEARANFKLRAKQRYDSFIDLCQKS